MVHRKEIDPEVKKFSSGDKPSDSDSAPFFNTNKREFIDRVYSETGIICDV
jgi:hypothetical protein